MLPWVREFLADFGPALALLAMTVVAVTWFHDVPTDTLPAVFTWNPALTDPPISTSVPASILPAL